MGNTADVMRRKIAASNAHDAKETLAVTLVVGGAETKSGLGAVRRPFCALDEASYHLDSGSRDLAAPAAASQAEYCPLRQFRAGTPDGHPVQPRPPG